MFCRFDTVHECDRQTNEQIVRLTLHDSIDHAVHSVAQKKKLFTK